MGLLPALERPPRAPAVTFPDGSLDYRALACAAAELRSRLPAAGALALWATPELATVVGLVAALGAGRTIVPINPRSGPQELAHILGETAPSALLAPEAVTLDGLPTISPAAAGDGPQTAPPVELPGASLIVYTSGTTGPPKGVILGVRAIEANLDALSRAWSWTAADVLVHALPLFHVHGLVVATLGTLRLGGSVHHLGGFDAHAVASALRGEATMLFAVPTMYHRLADAAVADASLAEGLRGARLLVSGSAALAAAEHARIEALCGQRIVERYGMTETLMITAVRADGERRAGYVGLPLDGVEVRVCDEDGRDLPADDATIGDVLVRSAALFDGYLGQPQATADAFRDGWFATGDLGTLAPDGYLRLVGRRSTDLIKSGGFRIGAGEIEGALLEHPAVAQAAVAGLPDEDLGERIVAWIVLRPQQRAEEDELIAHVAATLTPHKRPRAIRFVEDLPRNALGKVQKRLLVGSDAP